ncbi:MAG: L-ribulose-5-phosphate 4-epimerase [Clostridiales bacterium]|nr:L-ribulose-5-phosphate 4-epimerase [Clostridiales bacterium]
MALLYTLKKQVLEANKQLEKYGLVTFTWGNVSAVDREEGIMVIKPSGIPYEELKIEQLVVMSLDGEKIEGELNPSSDTPTHLYLYNNFPKIGGITHTHSIWATSFAQAKRPIVALGTTHADYFRGEVPCTRILTNEEVEKEYEKNTGKIIVELFNNLEESEFPGVLVANHGPFTWGEDAFSSVRNAKILETIAEMAYRTYVLNDNVKGINDFLINKHYLRKHGNNKYYGQNNE